MIYKKDVNERSPLRVFERSIHGGLGAGNLGVVLSRAGVGKTAFLVGVALDDLMRGRKVYHVNIDDPLEKVREFYDEVFYDLAESSRLEDREAIHLNVERHRMIHTFSRESFSFEKLRASLELIREHMHFEPQAIVIDGYPDFERASGEQLQQLKELAQEKRVEMWLTALTHRDDPVVEAGGIPTYVERFTDLLSVMVQLEPAGQHVRLQLLKDHENADVANLFLELDPRTLLLKWH